MKTVTPEQKEALKNEEWEHLLPVYERLLAAPDPVKYFAAIPSIAEGFKRNGRIVMCIDGRTPGGRHIAGAGINVALRKGDEYAFDLLRGMHPEGICSHEHCGAAALNAMLQGLDPAEGDRLGIEWAMKAAEAIGVPYLGHRPVGTPFHPELAAYYDGTGRLDPSRLPDHLVPGFDITRQYLKVQGDGQEELMLSIGIAFGPGGFAERFTKEHPFLVIVLGHPEVPGLSSRKLLTEVLPTVLASVHRDRIKVLEVPVDNSWLS